jgi:hypothetical protein
VRESASAVDKVTEPESHLGMALADTAARLGAAPLPLQNLRERDLSREFAEALRRRRLGTVVERRRIAVADFPRVGDVDIVIYAEEGAPVAVSELKWSTGPRDKIFEAAWDAVKLALLAEQHGVGNAWLVTGASAAAWGQTECADLFGDVEVDVHELWDRPLSALGPNGGRTVGDDLEIGGRGIMFVRAPERLSVRQLHSIPVDTVSGRWLLRASAVRCEGEIRSFVRRRSSDDHASLRWHGGDFPTRISQAWLDQNVPVMGEDDFAGLLRRLRATRWTADEIATRVEPLRDTHRTGVSPGAPS